MRQYLNHVLAVGVTICATVAPVLADRIVDIRDLETPKVAQIRFEHLAEKPISNRELRATIHTEEGTRFSRRFFRADLSTIENLYRSRGYLDVDFVRRSYSLDDDGALHIRLKIDSGARWTVSHVRVQFDGQDTLLASILRSRLRVAPDDVFRYGNVIDDERELLIWLNSEGFAHAQVHNQVDLDSRRQQAAVSYAVTTGKRMYFGALTIEQSNLQTRRSLLDQQFAFAEGQLYDPEKLRRTRNNLSRTGLFRSVTLATPATAPEDSVQPVVLRLQERKFVQLRSRLFVNNSEPGVSGRVQHTNFLGRGNQIGADASLGQPLQGLTLFLTERNLFGSTADLTLSAGMTDEWGDTRVFADPSDSMQLDLLTQNYSVAYDWSQRYGPQEVEALLSTAIYDYPSIERLLKLNAVVSRRWELSSDVVYSSNLTMNWTQSRNRPIRSKVIDFTVDVPDAVPEITVPSARQAQEAPFLYDPGEKSPGQIPINDTWIDLLTNEARTINFQLGSQRDARDNQIAPTKGSYLRAAVLFAFELGGSENRVFDGDLEARNYLRLADDLVWAQAVRGVMTGTLQNESALPQSYWKEFGGEGSVRGVDRNGITAVGGGRGGLVLRNELRLATGAAGFVLFWDRAGVWRDIGEASWGDMISGYGIGIRWDMGIPLRLDLGWMQGRSSPEVYVSIGQAF
jgi:outer membrane protein assembly factor BamA